MSDRPLPEGSHPELEERLVSYLDGELSADEASEIEHALAANPSIRRELRQFEACWQMLDELPRADVDESFTRSTVEMVAVRAQEDLAAQQAEMPRLRRRVGLTAVGAVLVAALVGYLIVGAVAERPNVELLRDLPVVENLDQYRQIEDIEFLRELHQRGFAEQPAAQSGEGRNGR